MPHARHAVTIDAPFAYVQELLTDKMERPRMYVGTVQSSSIVERGDGYIVREMFEPVPNRLLIREKIYRHPVEGGEEFVYEHLNNAKFTGFFRNILTRVDGRADQCRLEYVMDWSPHPGTEDPIPAAQADLMVKAGVRHLKELAENPPEAPDFILAFYRAVDSLDPKAMEPLLADNIRFRFGSHTDVLGKAAVMAMNTEAMKHWKSIKHHYVDVYQVRGKTFVEFWVEYVMPDDREYLLPFLTMFEHDGEKITNVKVFGDISPLHQGWPTEN